MKMGLVSASFPQLSPEEVVTIAGNQGMNAMEWSASCHIAAGEENKAAEIGRLSKAAGLTITGYGSDYCVIKNGKPQENFSAVLRTAQALGTDNISIKAGEIPSEKADEDFVYCFLEELAHISEIAAENKIALSFELHTNTLFDNYNSAKVLLERSGRNNLYIHWQPNQTASMIYNIYELKMLTPYIKNVYVFYQNALGEILPLAEGLDSWQQYINILRLDPDRALLLKPGPNHSLEELARDVSLLKGLV